MNPFAVLNWHPLHTVDIFPYLPYIVLVVIFIMVLIYVTLRLQYGFWFYQPVFHAYDFHYYYFYHGIIQPELPGETKFINKQNIDVMDFTAIQDHQTQQIVHFINAHFHRNGKNVYAPSSQNMVPYFQHHSHPCFVSWYHEPRLLQDDKTRSIVKDKELVGIMTTRPLHVKLTTGKTYDEFDVYYADYLCVHKDHRKKNIAPQLIQTHEYHQRHANPHIVVSLFKREGQLTGIVPLCVYPTFCFSNATWKKPDPLSIEYEVLEATPQNYMYLHEFMQEVTVQHFQVIMTPTIANVFELMKSKNLFVYYVLEKHSRHIVAAYFFKDSCMNIDERGKALTCIASVFDRNKVDNGSVSSLFVQGFKNAFWRIVESNPYFAYCVMEQVSDNGMLVDSLMAKTTPWLVSPAAFFFYNFAFPTVPSHQVFVLS